MTDDRDRRAAEEWIEERKTTLAPTDEESLMEVFPSDIPSLAALLTAARAEGAAEAIEAAAQAVLAAQASKRSSGATNASVLPVSLIIDRIRAAVARKEG